MKPLAHSTYARMVYSNEEHQPKLKLLVRSAYARTVLACSTYTRTVLARSTYARTVLARSTYTRTVYSNVTMHVTHTRMSMERSLLDKP